MKRFIARMCFATLFAFLIFSTFVLPTHAEEDESLYRDCEYSTTNRSREGLREIWDTNSSSDYIIKGPGKLNISWEDPVIAGTLYLEWKTLPKDFTLTQFGRDGSTVETTAGETYQLNQLYSISKDTRSITLSSQTDMDICTAVVYGPDKTPKDHHPWNATPDKLDYLIIVTHPDDDAIFMGAIIPTYGVERGLNGTILYTCSSNIRYRCNEALNGAWVMGLRNHPIFANFPDILPSQKDQWEFQFTINKLTNYYVRIIRQYKPEIIISHDIEGEYGHWQHKYVSKAVCQAVELAADDTYDPESITQYGVFQVKKLYIHLYPENVIKLDVITPLKEFDNRNIIEISEMAFQQHVSQAQASHLNENHDGVYSLSDFGLYFSIVGKNTTTNDMFENIDPELLSNYISPTPIPTETQSINTLTILSNCDTPDSNSPPQDIEMNQESIDWLLYLLIALLVVTIFVGAVFGVSLMKKHPSTIKK